MEDYSFTNTFDLLHPSRYHQENVSLPLVLLPPRPPPPPPTGVFLSPEHDPFFGDLINIKNL